MNEISSIEGVTPFNQIQVWASLVEASNHPGQLGISVEAIGDVAIEEVGSDVENDGRATVFLDKADAVEFAIGILEWVREQE